MIKEYQIEDTIVAYFDGMLNDEDSAELLHRVSVSPEIRELYQEHEAIRGVAYRAARNVSVSPELEESVFTRIAALQEAGREKLVPVAFWTLPRISAMAGAAALIALGLLAPWRTSDSFVKPANSPVLASGQATEMTQATKGTQTLGANSPFAENPRLSGRKFSSEIGKRNSSSSDNGNLIAEAIPVPSIPSQIESDPAIQIIPQAAEADRINMPSVGNAPKTLRLLSGLPDMDNAPMFEIGLATATPGFNAPADVTTKPQIISEMALRAAYNFDSRNQIGLRVTRVDFPAIQTVDASGYKSITTESQMGLSEELYYKHRVPINDGLLYISGGIGGGFYTSGTLLSAELGLEMPMSDKLVGGISLIVNSMHQSSSESAVSSSIAEPVIYDNTKVYNRLAGRIEFGLMYGF